MSNYQPGDFLKHREYGVGQVKAIQEEYPREVQIDFKENGKRTLTEELVNRSASRLSPEGFHAYAYLEPLQANLLLQEDPVESICKVLEDFRGRRAKTEDFKEYLSTYISDWKIWWENTQPLLKESPRIDSTKSKLKEYGILQEELAPAKAAYRSFRRYRRYESFPLVYDQARRVLRELERGESLAEDEIEDLLGYFRQVITSDQFPIGERLDAFFRMVEGKWLPPERIQTQLAELLQARFRIYDLDSYSQQRIVKYLIQRPLDDVTLGLLTTGMGAQAATIQILQDWAIRRSDPAIIERLLVVALREHLPPVLSEEEYPDLKARLFTCIELVRCLPSDTPGWPEIITALQAMNKSIGSVVDLQRIKFLLVPLVKLAWELYQRTPQLNLDENLILDSLVDPELRVEYIVSLLEAVVNSKLPKEFSDKMELRFLTNAEKRGDDYLLPLLSWRWDNSLEQAAALVGFIVSLPSHPLIERAGRALCEIGLKADEATLVNFLPYLNHFHRLQGTWTWSSQLEGLREKAYYEHFVHTSKISLGAKYQDPALDEAVRQYVELQLASAHKENREQRQLLSQYQVRIHELESQLKEKESVLRELRSNTGGESKEARFEERSRILKDLVGSMAEFERYAASQPARSKEIEAVLRQLENLTTSYKVIPQEAIGSQVEFTPQRHRLVEGGELFPGETVLVVERGFLIRDLQDRLRLLKPALVKKPFS